MNDQHPELYLIRHGETDWNAEQRLQGQRDIPLNQKGRQQASSNGARLKTLIDPTQYDFIASPLGRTMETMQRVRTSMGIDKDGFATDDRLKEVSFGDLEGFTLNELEDQYPQYAKARKSDRWHFVPPNGESYDMTSVRVLEWLNTIKRPSVVVAHGGIIRVLRKYFLNLTASQIEEYYVTQDKIFHWQIENGKVVEELL